MTVRRLLELWEAPAGYRLASLVATTYELHADFLEEDLLPLALGLRLPPARGREFRVELERALQEVEVSVLFHPGRYQRGLRRSPRMDLVPLPEGRFPKLHAKVALLRFVRPDTPAVAAQVVRLVVGSANLTNPGYRSNLEVAAAIDDAPGAAAEVATAVRDAAAWLKGLVAESTAQLGRQLRELDAVFAARPVRARRERLRFIGLPSRSGFPPLAGAGERIDRLTIASPFWPTGDDQADVAAALYRLCGRHWPAVRLIGPADLDDQHRPRPVIPAAFVSALLAKGARVSVAAADPGFGCAADGQDAAPDDEDEFDALAGRPGARPAGRRDLHAKALLAEGRQWTRLAIGSFNLTRKGLGLTAAGNAEAGLLWTAPTAEAAALGELLSFATGWRQVRRAPGQYVVEPPPRDGAEDGGAWPGFILSLRARRTELIVEGDAASWPGEVEIRMRDIRARLKGREEWFDPWSLTAPPDAAARFTATTALTASWLEDGSANDLTWPVLPDLEAEVSWDDHRAVVPVCFEDKHLFPVVEPRTREDERALIAWFLGLRPTDEAGSDGFGHGIDPLPEAEQAPGGHRPAVPDGDILSYLVRDFVHALPGIRNHLADAGITETGLRTALLGPRSPVALAQQVAQAHRQPAPGRPRKTIVATVFQLAELQRLLTTVPLPPLADGVGEVLRAEAIDAVAAALRALVPDLPAGASAAVLRDYLDPLGSPP